MRVRFKDWVNDWRYHVRRLEEAAERQGQASDARIGITFEWRGREYEVMTVALFDPVFDEGRKLARITSRDFDNKVALYSHRTRDTGLARVVTNKGKPRYLIEQGEQAAEWATVVESMPATHLAAAVREGSLGLGKLQRILNSSRARDGLRQLAESARHRIFEAEQEIKALQLELSMIDHEVAKLEKVEKA